MENRLTLKSGGIVALEAETGLADMLKPLIREIHLFDTFIAGTTYLKDPGVLDDVKAGDKLVLQREDNKFDEKRSLS